MNTHLLVIALATALVLRVAAVAPASEANSPPESHFGHQEGDWKRAPFELIAFLIRQQDRGGAVVTVADAPKGWIKEEHIDLLVLLLDSKEPCAAVGPARSSRVDPPGQPKKTSTVGHEAAYLIASYRHGLFPMSGTEPSTELDLNRKELKEWWAQRRKR